MPGRQVRNKLDVCRGHTKLCVKIRGSVDDRRHDRAVGLSGEEVHSIAHHIGNGADLAFGRALLGLLGKRARIANAPYAQQIEHAAVDGLGEIEEGGARPWNGVREYAFRTAVGSARDNRCAGDEIGVRHLELPGHVRAGRNT